MFGKITGFGGVFIKVPDPIKSRKWYKEFLNVEMDEYGCTFSPSNPENGLGEIAFSFFPENSKYLDPSKASFMLNFRVKNVEDLIKTLNEKGVSIIGEIIKDDFGTFAHIIDCNGIKIELWEPKS